MPDSTNANAHIPPTINHLIGQSHLIEKLRVALESSFADNRPLPHTLMTGPPGTGKTMLTKVLAREMASKYTEVMGQSLASVEMLHGTLVSHDEPKWIILIDEAHEMPLSVQTALLKIIDDNAVLLPFPKENSYHKIDLMPFTLALATTDPQKLLQPLRDRLKLVCQLRRYEGDDLVRILRQKSTQLGWEVADEVLEQVAVRAFGTPRLAVRLLESIHRTARAEGVHVLSSEHASKTFQIEEIDELGLGPDERMYLRILNESSKPVRLGVIASRMGQPPVAISQVVESNLLWLGLIERTDKGRLLTGEGMRHVRSY